MCRYAEKRYKLHYVCFDCRKTFKQPLIEDMVMQNGDWHAYQLAYPVSKSEKSEKFRNENPELIRRFEEQYRNKKQKCPDCGAEMYNVGRDFKSPKKDKIREWEIVRGMYKIGHTFESCGCHGPGYIPQKKADYIQYLENVKSAYENALSDRSMDYTAASELTEYLDYWNARLLLVINALQQLKTV